MSKYVELPIDKIELDKRLKNVWTNPQILRKPLWIT